MADKLSIHEAIPRIIEELPPIGKESEMTEGPRYSYRGIEDILPHVKELFAKYGVFVVPMHRIRTDELITTARGAQMRRVTTDSMFAFTASDGSSIGAQTLGEAHDAGDKATNKAETSAYKYALVQLFNITGGDDPDHHRPELTDPDIAPEGYVRLEDGQLPTYRNYEALRTLGPLLRDAGVAEQLRAWMADQRIDSAAGKDEEGLGRAVEQAYVLLRDPVDAKPDPVADTEAALERLASGFPGAAESDDEPSETPSA